MRGNFTDFFLMEELAGMAGGKPPQMKVVEKAGIDRAGEQLAQGARGT